MSTENPVAEASTESARPFLRIGLGILVGIAIATFLLYGILYVASDSAIALMSFVSVAVLPAVWTTVIISGGVYQRAFAIGALFPLGAFALLSVFHASSPFSNWERAGDSELRTRLVILFFWLSSLFVGLVCVGVRRLIAKRTALPCGQSPNGSSVPEQSQAEIPSRFQFGIGTLLWITTVTAIICAIFFRIPPIVAIPLMALISGAFLPAIWATVIVCGRGYQRAFGIGAVFPAVICMWLVLRELLGLLDWPRFHRWDTPGEEEFTLRLAFLAFWASSIVGGMICIGVRRLLKGRPDSRSH